MKLERLLAKWKEFALTRKIPPVNLPSIAVPLFSRITLLKAAAASGGATALYGLGHGSYKLMGSLGSESSLEDYLPEGFKELELGMSYAEVQKIRPSMRNSGKEESAHEKITQDSQTFNNILLAFEKKLSDYSHSKQIEVSYTFNDNQFKRIGFSVLGLYGLNWGKGIISKLGEPTRKHLSTEYLWEKEDGIIHLGSGEL